MKEVPIDETDNIRFSKVPAKSQKRKLNLKEV